MSFFLKGTVCSVVLLSALALTLFKVRNNINLHRKSFIHLTHSCLHEESTHSNYYLIIQTVCLYNESNLLTEGIPPVSMGSRTFLWKEVIPVSLRSRNSRKLQNCVKAWNLVETHIRQRSLTKSRERRRVFTGSGCSWVLHSVIVTWFQYFIVHACFFCFYANCSASSCITALNSFSLYKNIKVLKKAHKCSVFLLKIPSWVPVNIFTSNLTASSGNSESSLRGMILPICTSVDNFIWRWPCTVARALKFSDYLTSCLTTDTGDIYTTARTGPALGLARAAAFTSAIWTRFESEVWCHRSSKNTSSVRILPDQISVL